MKKIVNQISSTIFTITKLLYVLVHLATVILVFLFSGFLAATGALMLPIIAPLGVAIAMWIRYGFFNLYTVIVISMFAISLISALVTAITDDEPAYLSTR